MSFQDDSHILSRLGILDSKDESPYKIRPSPKKSNIHLASEKDRFVEVSIDGAADSNSETDDEPVFDRNSLLSPSKGVKVYRRKNESFTCVYLVLLITYFTVGVCRPVPWIAMHSGKEIPYSFLLENSAGLLTGCILGKLLCQRLNLVLLSFFATASLCCLSWIVSLFPKVFDGRVAICLFGFFSGNILYVGLALWLVYWRGYNRKALFLYVLLALGSSLVAVNYNKATLSGDTLGLLTPQIFPHKRQADIPFIPFSNETLDISNSSGNATAPKPRKPHIVEGIKTVETKSEQNEQMRKAAASNKTQADFIIASSTTLSTSSFPVLSALNDSQLPGSTSSSLLPSTTKIVATTSTRAFEFIQSSAPTATESSSSGAETPINHNYANVRMVTIVTTTALAFYTLASVFCCLPCSVISDLKFLKLYDPSIAGLTAGCRIRVALLQITASFLEGLIELVAMVLSQQQGTANPLFLHHILVAVSRIVMLISGPIAYSLFGCSAALLCSMLGSVLLLVDSADSTLGFILASVGTGAFGLLVLFYIEICVNPRGGTQLDYFTFPSVIGRCLCSAFAVLLPSADANRMIVVVLFANAPLLVTFVLLVKSLRKAAKLKEIMEYSSSPVLETVGEYVSLIERNIDYDSGEEAEECDGLTS